MQEKSSNKPVTYEQLKLFIKTEQEKQKEIDALINSKKRMASSTRHVHQYIKKDIGQKKSYVIFACNLPDCNHYLTPELVIGKKSLCPHCDEEFILTRKNISETFPHCPECVNPQHWKARQKADLREVISESVGDLIAAELLRKRTG